jgi:hypothetical protein
VALLAVLVAGLLRSHAEILRSLHDLGAGLDPDAAPAQPAGSALSPPHARTSSRAGADVAGVTPTGDAISVAIVGARHPTLLAFLTSGCTTCADFWSAFSDTDALEVPGDARLVVVTKGEDGESSARLRKFTPPDVPVVMSSDAWRDYDVPVAPYFAYVEGGSGGIVGEGAAMSWSQLSGMMTQALDEAGLSRSGARGRGPRGETGHAREQRAERALRAAGIEPGDPSLYPKTAEDLHDHGN